MKMRSTKKHLLIVTSVPFPYGNGANSNFLTNFCRGLEHNGNNVDLLLRGNSHIKSSIFEGIKYTTSCKYQTKFALLNKLINSCFNICYPIFYLLRNRKNVDMVITFQNEFSNSIFLLLFAKIFTIPIFQLMVDFYTQNSFFNGGKKNFSRKIRYLDYKAQYFFLAKYYDGAIVLSTFLKKHFLKLGFVESKILIQPHLIDMNIFKQALKKPIFEGNITKFGVLGSINFKNGIFDLLSAYKILSDQRSDCELMLIGGSKSEFQYCETIINEMHIKGKYTFVEKVNYRELTSIISDCDAFVLPRRNNIESIAGFPTKIGEICSSKRILIVTNYGDIPLYFSNKVNAIVVDVGEPKSIAKGMLWVMDYHSLANSIAHNGFKWVENNIDFIKGTEKIDSFLNRFISK